MEKRKNPTIMIGIGGTGVKTMDVLKKKLQESEKTSLDENVQYLVVDSEEQE